MSTYRKRLEVGEIYNVCDEEIEKVCGGKHLLKLIEKRILWGNVDIDIICELVEESVESRLKTK